MRKEFAAHAWYICCVCAALFNAKIHAPEERTDGTMTWERGTSSVEIEMSKMQSWIENADIELHGQNGEGGVVREWRDFCAQRKAFESFVRVAFAVIGFLVGLPGVLISLSALGLVHLK